MPDGVGYKYHVGENHTDEINMDVLEEIPKGKGKRIHAEKFVEVYLA